MVSAGSNVALLLRHVGGRLGSEPRCRSLTNRNAQLSLCTFLSSDSVVTAPPGKQGRQLKPDNCREEVATTERYTKDWPASETALVQVRKKSVRVRNMVFGRIDY